MRASPSDTRISSTNTKSLWLAQLEATQRRFPVLIVSFVSLLLLVGVLTVLDDPLLLSDNTELKLKPTKMGLELEALATKYFEVWNTHDGAAVGGLFADGGSLRDWDISVTGAKEVGEANGNIFTAVPKINITIEKIHPSPSTNTAVCEILVHLNNDDKEVLKVTDVIEFDADGKILALRAYKG